MQDQTHGFDSVYEISSERFLRVLERLIVDDIPQFINPLNFNTPLPVSGLQTGAINFPLIPVASLEYPAQFNGSSFTLVLRFPEAVLSLNDVLNTTTNLPSLRGLVPTSVGTVTFKLPLAITTATNSGGTASPIQIAMGSLNDATLTNIATAQLTGLISLPAGLNLQEWVNNISRSVETAMKNRFNAFLPRIIDINFPGTDFCGLRLRNLQLKLLPGTSTTTNSLAFFTTLRENTTGNLSMFTQSGLPLSQQGSLLVANRMLIKLICCAFPKAAVVLGLPAEHEDSPDGLSCTWRNVANVTLEGKKYTELRELKIGWENDLLVLSGYLHDEVSYCVRANIKFSIKIKFVLSATGSITSEAFDPVDPEIETWVRTLCWIVLAAVLIVILATIGAAAGAFIGALAGSVLWGAIIGAGVGAIGAILLTIMIKNLLETNALASLQDAVAQLMGPIGGAVQNVKILPTDLTDTFGTLDLLKDLVVDDFQIFGKVGLMDVGPPVASSDDQVLQPGEMINLDNGRVYRADANTIDGDGDLIWRRSELDTQAVMYRYAGSVTDAGVYRTLELADRSTAHMVVLQNASYLSLTRADCEALEYSTNTHTVVPQQNIPIPDPRCAILATTPATTTTMMMRVRTTGDNEERGVSTSRMRSSCNDFVFAVRTTEGRYCRCKAWRDNYENIHLKYTTFNTQLPLEFSTHLRRVRGTIMPATRIAGQEVAYKTPVSWRGTIKAISEHMVRPYQYVHWQWQGMSITNFGILPGTQTSYRIMDNVLNIQTQMGETLDGILGVIVRDASGWEVFKTRDLQLDGHAFVADTIAQVPQMALPSFPLQPLVTNEEDRISFKDQMKHAVARQLNVRPEEINM